MSVWLSPVQAMLALEEHGSMVTPGNSWSHDSCRLRNFTPLAQSLCLYSVLWKRKKHREGMNVVQGHRAHNGQTRRELCGAKLPHPRCVDLHSISSAH